MYRFLPDSIIAEDVFAANAVIVTIVSCKYIHDVLTHDQSLLQSSLVS